jgi:hypothetical protein
MVMMCPARSELIYLSGPAAPEIAILFSAGPIDAIALDGPAP